MIERRASWTRQSHNGRLILTNDNLQTFTEETALVASLKACAKARDLSKGSRIHADIVKRGLLRENIFIGNTLVDLYGKCCALGKAQAVFDELRIRTVVSWNVLIAGYAQSGCSEDALNCYRWMLYEGFSPNAVTFVCILKVCGRIGAVDMGTEIHAQVVREGLLESHFLLGTALVDMYAKCGALQKAKEVFDGLFVRDVVVWNALIAGFAKHGQGEEALSFFEQMQEEGFTPNAVTFVCILKACGSIAAADKGKELHEEIVKMGLLENNIQVGTALLDMYVKCGATENALWVLDKLRARDVVSWTALIAGYLHHGHSEEALYCFERMQHEGFSPNAITFVCVLKACGSIGSVDRGRAIHTEIAREELLGKNIVVDIALMDMYAKCGVLEKAREVFDELPVRDVVSWTIVLTGYALLGKDDDVFFLFNKMIGEGVVPDLTIFTIVLNACRHSGQVEKGQFYFKCMSIGYGIIPTPEHCACMVDLFGRAGHLDMAVAMIKKMFTCDHLPIWTSLLGACQQRGIVTLGRLAFEQAVQLNEKQVAAHVCMSNIYAAFSMQNDAEKSVSMSVKNKE